VVCCLTALVSALNCAPKQLQRGLMALTGDLGVWPPTFDSVSVQCLFCGFCSVAGSQAALDKCHSGGCTGHIYH